MKEGAMRLRDLVVLSSLLASPGVAFADASVAGQWEADLGDNVKIAMDVLADGHWSSQTVQGDKVVATMSGTYTQTKRNGTSGTLVFKPAESHVSAQHGKPTVEHDTYSLENDRQVLRLVANGDVMEFHRQELGK
jgi:hypothetical protein